MCMCNKKFQVLLLIRTANMLAESVILNFNVEKNRIIETKTWENSITVREKKS